MAARIRFYQWYGCAVPSLHTKYGVSSFFAVVSTLFESFADRIFLVFRVREYKDPKRLPDPISTSLYGWTSPAEISLPVWQWLSSEQSSVQRFAMDVWWTGSSATLRGSLLWTTTHCIFFNLQGSHPIQVLSRYRFSSMQKLATDIDWAPSLH